MSSHQVSQMTNAQLHAEADLIAARIVNGKTTMGDSMRVVELSNRLLRADSRSERCVRPLLLRGKLHGVIRGVMQHHGLTTHGDAVVEADLIAAMCAALNVAEPRT